MADQSDIATSIAGLLAGVFYPNGTGQPSVAPGAAPVRIYEGWPIPNRLETDLRAGGIHISIWPTQSERVTESNAVEFMPVSLSVATIAMLVAGSTVTVSGAGGSGQNAALLIDGQPYVYPVQASDTPITVAAALAALIGAARPASSSGPVITVPGMRAVVARVGVQGTGIRILQRRDKLFQITVWANTPALRSGVGSLLDATLAGTPRATMADGTAATFRYRSTVEDDGKQKADIFRRDIMYSVEYCVTDSVTATQIVVEQLNVAVPAATQSITVYS